MRERSDGPRGLHYAERESGKENGHGHDKSGERPSYTDVEQSAAIENC